MEGMVARAALLVLGVSGMGISLYFTLVYYKFLSAERSVMPKFCRMEEGECMRVIQAPEARLLGIPNFVLGIFYYGGVILLAIFSPLDAINGGVQLVSAATVVAVVCGGYLIFVLLFKLKVNCVLCYAAHGINFCVLLVLLSILLGERSN